MKNPAAISLQQVHLTTSPEGYEPVVSYKGDQSIYIREHQTLQAELLRFCPSESWYQGSHKAACPRPILITKRHQEQLRQLHDALTLALTDIIQRWWTDQEAQFPARMPLEEQEEKLLRWLEIHHPFDCRHHLGSWRPDFLVEDDHTDVGATPTENFRLTEINARFSFNGLMYEAYGQEALTSLGAGRRGIMHGTNPADIFNGLLCLFQRDRPLHLLKGDEPGMDIHMVIGFLERHLGTRPRLITPSDLRLVPDPQENSGYKLCCLVKSNPAGVHINESPVIVTDDGEVVEEIHQVGLELHQRELLAIPPEMLRQVSLRCFNDMRTILLVHDKRMLGIIKQEIPSLTARGVLSCAQGKALRKGIADTILPGSSDLTNIISLCTEDVNLQTDYLLKPIRGGKGAGILFGDELGHSEWMSALERMKDPRLTIMPGTPKYVIQRRIWPRLYDVILNPSGEKGQHPLIGTYHAIHGQLLGFGIWRSSSDRICAVSHGGGWICSIQKTE
ncbi:hypothetical protein ARAM_000215 [Aspergillus rambellii]|uniref:Uncharacterized protein n=1 Tax=Aspergillus rambellii TaxID=308745 RepID=A0A0F8UT15_9EURO|nr:hypothetical protein ARAM_000215 [Aspergillus rambellii]